MNEQSRNDCQYFETLIASWFDDDVASSDRGALKAHMAACASCRESFELAERMEAALVSRRDDVPPVDAFLPAFSAARSPFAHPRLVAAFRTMMSPAGIAIVLVMWSTLLALRFRDSIASVFAWSSAERFTAWLNNLSSSLMGASSNDPYTLVAVYVILALVVLGSTGAMTLRYIRHS